MAERVLRGGGEECVLDIPTWDFNWQDDYQLVQPIQLSTFDSLTLTCEWDNSAENQPIIGGEQQEPEEASHRQSP